MYVALRRILAVGYPAPAKGDAGDAGRPRRAAGGGQQRRPRLHARRAAPELRPAAARAGDGPILLEARTFRLLGHIFGADFSYVPKEDLSAAEERASMTKLRQWIGERQVSEKELTQIEEDVDAEIDEAVAFALESEPPDPDDIRFDIYETEQAA